MIPLHLTLKNFLSYGPNFQTIDFTPYSLICLAGKNGHGKSALLDALTWALWGQARKINGAVKADEGLVRLGAQSMIVRLDFIVNNIVYRVKRECTLSGTKSAVVLEFGMIDQETETLIPLTDKTIKATQEKITACLGLDYDGFVNSVFLRQGQSHEFSKKTPKERKDILSTILGLDNYEVIRRRALDKIKETENSKIQFILKEQAITTQLEQLPTVILQKQEIFQAITINNEQEQTIAEQLATTRAHLQKLTTLEQHYYYKETAYKQAIHRYTELHAEFVKIATTWRAIQRTKKILNVQSLLEQERQTLEQELTTIEHKQQRSQELKDSLFICKEQIQSRCTAIKNKAQTELQNLFYRKERLIMLDTTLTQTLNELQTKELGIKKLLLFDRLPINHFTKACKTLCFEQAQELLDYYIHGFQQLSGKKIALEAAQIELNQKNSFATTDQNSCPWCTQILTHEQHEALTTKYTKKWLRITHQLTRLNRILPILQKRATYYQKFLHACIQAQEIANAIDAKQQEQIINQHNLKTLEIEIIETQKNNDAALTADAQLQKLIEQRNQLEKELNDLAYDSQALIRIKQRHKETIQELMNIIKLVQELAQQDKRKEQCYKLGVQLKEIKAEQKQLSLVLQEYKQQLTFLASYKEQETLLTRTRVEILAAKEDLFKQQGSLEQQHRFLEKIAEEQELIKLSLKTLNKQSAIYQAIAQALGKDGIPALIIEQALPEIEQEANRVLSKLTDNQAHLTIDSLKNLKTGAIRETLDIKISDAVGIRPYEMFSGGEAFRIDFALRLAISKLLAQRAGTSLQTLIIDEGFGSQDDEGLQHIMDALHKVQEDFAKIIVISHLPAIKEHFPVHFMVTKSPQGSSVAIFEQG